MKADPALRLPVRTARPRAAVLVVVAMLIVAPDAVWAVARSCGANAITNTANVLCAAPSGPCTATAVTMSANIEVSAGGCVFDLGGRTLRIEKTLQMTGLGFIDVGNVGAVTITSTGKLKARGDFVQPNGFIIGGGGVSLNGSNTITVAGTIDVSGDPAGTVVLSAPNGVTLQSGSLVQGNGMTTFVSDGDRIADGGDVDVRASAGVVTMAGDLSVTGTQHGAGGLISVEAGRSVTVSRQIDASGGASDGGVIAIAAADAVLITAPLSVESRGGGGFGGEILIDAGDDALGGIAVGGGVTVDGVALKLDGSASDTFGGDGGVLDVRARGTISFQGAGVSIRANAGGQFDGYGGLVVLDARDAAPNQIGPLDGHVTVNGIIQAQSGAAGGTGGLIVLYAGRDLTMNAFIDGDGKDGGGEVVGTAGGAIALTQKIDVSATGSTGAPGAVDLRAGAARNADLTVGADVLAFGGTASSASRLINLSGCTLGVSPGVKIDGHAGTVSGVLGGSVINLISRHVMPLGASSQYLANPGGHVETIHPAGQNPFIYSGVVFNPVRVDTVVAQGPYEACPTP